MARYGTWVKHGELSKTLNNFFEKSSDALRQTLEAIFREKYLVAKLPLTKFHFKAIREVKTEKSDAQISN